MKTLQLVLVCLVAACGGSGATMQTQKPITASTSLFDRLGGLDAIKVVVDDFTANVVADPAINARFASTDINVFKARLVEQICEVAGGGCTYTGRSMAEAHAGMNISDDEFGALLADLKRSLDKFKVPEREQAELLSALGDMKDDIVNR
jgi:hemoglobin